MLLLFNKGYKYIEKKICYNKNSKKILFITKIPKDKD